MTLITESWRTAIGQGYILTALALEIYGYNIRNAILSIPRDPNTTQLIKRTRMPY